MSEAKPTPGPWRAVPHEEIAGGFKFVEVNGWKPVAQADVFRSCIYIDCTIADARLIASAPDLVSRVEHLEAVNAKLLAACEKAARVVEVVCGSHTDTYAMLAAAIKEGRG